MINDPESKILGMLCIDFRKFIRLMIVAALKGLLNSVDMATPLRTMILYSK